MPLPVEPSAPRDFDFIIGDWHVRHRRLNSRLTGCTEWTEFDGLSSTSKTLGGFGNVEDNILRLADGVVRAAAVRSFDPASRQWSIWWLDGTRPHQLDTPVVGAFTGGTGVFFADDSLRGMPIKVRFTWNANPGRNPTWEQAFSQDAGATWETNWTMEFSGHRASGRGAMPPSRTASCSCGQLSVTVDGDPLRISVCHCLACQRRTGSVFGAQARFPAASARIEGRSKQYVRTGDSGNPIMFNFCPDCGATVHYAIGEGLIAIPVGAFADPAFPAPRFSVYEDRMHAWVDMPNDVEHMR